MTYTVRCTASNGSTLDLRVDAPSETAACAAATKRAAEQAPHAGHWYPAYALED